MATRNLYLHETVDIVGQGHYDYMEHVAKEPTNVMPGMLKLQGSFFVCAMGGGRWPQVINVWDVGPDGWQAWASNVDRLNLKRRKAFYGDWWDQAAQWRSGGFDRLCGGVSGSPTTSELAERRVTGTLFVHQALSVRPGSAIEYLATVVEQQVPLWREHGHEPTGIYEVLGNQHEVVVIWATSIAAQDATSGESRRGSGMSDEAAADDRLVDWERQSTGYITGGESHLMTPLPGTVYGPDDWEDASLDDWLKPSTS